MTELVRYYYRGTTRGWPGNDCLRAESITCTTIDPVVATLFAIECRNHGRSIILVAPVQRFVGLDGPRNHDFLVESAVNLIVEPAEFARRAVLSIGVDTSLAVLADLGFPHLPPRMFGKGDLREALHGSYSNFDRLSLHQIELYNRRIFEVVDDSERG